MVTHLVVIGGGTVGVKAANMAAALGARVTLVSDGEIGGRTTWDSLVPSKVLLTAADTLGDAQRALHRGVRLGQPEAHLQELMERIRQRAGQWADLQRQSLQQAGVQVLQGVASFRDASTLSVKSMEGVEVELPFDKALIATGSVPIFPPTMKPDGNRILAPRFVSQLRELPQHIIMVGGGVTGSEFAYLFRTLGSAVTVVTDMPRLLPRADEEVSTALEDSFTAQCIVIRLSAPVQAVELVEDGVEVTLASGERIQGSHAFIAIGRRADLDRLNLQAAGVESTPSGVATNEFMRTTASNIYAVGDAAGAPYTLNRGLAQAYVAVKHALGVATTRFRPEMVVEAVYTHPQVAQVGLTEAMAQQAGYEVTVKRSLYAHTFKAQLLGVTKGFVKVLEDRHSAKLLGASAFGEHAADVLAPVAVAIAQGVGIDALAPIFPAHPTFTEALFDALH